MTTPKITTKIRRKLERINRLQHEVNKLLSEVQDEAGVSGINDDDNWDWRMYVSDQGRIPSAEDAEIKLIEFMELKQQKAQGESP